MLLLAENVHNVQVHGIATSDGDRDGPDCRNVLCV